MGPLGIPVRISVNATVYASVVSPFLSTRQDVRGVDSRGRRCHCIIVDVERVRNFMARSKAKP